MKPVGYLPQLVTVLLVSLAAAAQSPRGFPLDQRFIAASLNGESFGGRAPTILVKADSSRQALRGTGFAGCNSWFGQITLGQRQFSVGGLGTTKMFCADRMAEESRFLNALKLASRWRMDGANLVLEGDSMRLVLLPEMIRKP